MQDEKIFDRIEKKYIIDEPTKTHMLEQITQYMERDHYHQSKVFNIYFDTDNFDLIIQSIEQPKFKEKLRARSYGGYDKVFLEIKTKLRGKENNVGYKRRVLITKKDYDKLIHKKSTIIELASKKQETPSGIQIAKEVDYLIQHFNLEPKIIVYYDRESYTGENKLRITFDENLKYRTKNLKFTENSRDKHYFKDENNIIMEIKAHGVLPLWLVKALSAEHAYPQQFSKVGHSYTLIRKEQNV
ncbi:polyphosphate polymerase domain-containing protein [Candidatus Saccharibacteria bacterium]|nr:polyphosphate polymerase domain-containing protein [Candidatus Saccharibacteria bacterium]